MHSYLTLNRLRPLAFIIPAIFLWGCVGEGDGPQRIPGTPAAAQTGVLINSPVSGVTFDGSSDLSGVTNDMGEFQYRPFDLVTFSVGGIVLGTAQGAPYISVVELTNSVDPTSPAATNMLVFLQSIDADGDPTNGITVSSATRTAAAGQSLNFSAADFDTQVAAVVAAVAPGNSVISASDALFNFYQTYASLGGTDTFDFGFPGFPPVGGGLTYELI
ncbi:MAG: hypothetical protein HKN59_09640, partial [Gammaproteobacteria bacterium]|nr:hypothetical protein [Gammaproteobacteria bacterium]